MDKTIEFRKERKKLVLC